MKASLNFALMNNDALTMVSNCQLAINTLAADENVLQAVRDSLKASGIVDKKEVNDRTADERANVRASKERADAMCTMFITRYIDVADAVAGEIYHFDVEAFLRNIGALSDGEVDKKVVKKVEAIRSTVVDRVKESVTRRKKGDDFLTAGERKEVKNTPIELVLAIIAAMLESGAIERVGGGLAVKKFDK